MKRRILIALMLLCCLALCACETHAPFENVPDPVATITLTNGKVMRFRLDLEAAPNTVANFVELAQKGYYDGLTFFRVVPGGFIQSGAKKNQLTDDAGYYIQGEFSENGIENPLSHTRGTISMCRQESDMDSASSQFFIMQGSYPEYDGKYAAFGRAADEETIKVIDEIGSVMVDYEGKPVGSVYTISTVRIDAKGYTYESAKIDKEEKKDKKKDNKEEK